jgi:hypothetical protein
MRSASFAVAVVSISITSSAVSAAAVQWTGSPVQYDTGSLPSAAQATNVWADAHQGTVADYLWYHVNGQSPYNYDRGWFPSVATDTFGNYIDIHQASSTASEFFSKIGYDNGTGAQYMLNSSVDTTDGGMMPFIAVHGHMCDSAHRFPAFGDIVQVHQGGTGPGPLWMNVGRATNIDCNNSAPVFNRGTAQWGSVTWLGAEEYNASGAYPSIAINAFPTGLAACYLEVHQAGNTRQVVWTSGEIDISGSNGMTPGTSWSFTQTATGTFVPAGQHPSVCIYDGANGANFSDTGVVVMEFNDGTLWSFDGPIGTSETTGASCQWNMQNIQQYDRGVSPSLSCQNGLLSNRGGVRGIEVHQAAGSTPGSPTTLWSHTFTDPTFP